MIIYDLHVMSIIIVPSKYDPPLIVNPDTVKVFDFTF